MHRILQVGSSPKEILEKWLEKDEICSVVVLEPHQQQVQQLKKQYSGQSKLQIVAAALSPQLGVQTLVDYNLPGFSSLSPATGLKRLFPGLQTQQNFEVNTLSPAKFLEQYGPDADQTATLVIHAKGYEAELIQELVSRSDLLSFTEVLLYTSPVPLYEHSTETAVLLQQLVEAGYELVHEQAISPEWIESSFKRNTAQDEILLLREQLKEKEQQIQKQEAQQQVLQAELEKIKKERLAKDNSFMLQRQETHAKIKELEQVLQQEQEKNKQHQIEQGVVAELQNQMEQLFNQQASQIQQATKALGKHVTKSFLEQRKHSQVLEGLKQYLEKGEQPLNFDAWSMSVDTLTHLVRHIELNNYDVIIEFGSGTSTVMMAKAIAQRLTSKNYNQLTKSDSNKKLPYRERESHSFPRVSNSQAAALLNKAEYNLPCQIISFEQDINYLNQTKQVLASYGVSQVVDLILAPLVPMQHSALLSEQKHLFYDCEKQLCRLADLYNYHNANVLVVVDGPFSPENDQIIIKPALEVVLQYLAKCNLSFFVNGVNQDKYESVFSYWDRECRARGFELKKRKADESQDFHFLSLEA